MSPGQFIALVQVNAHEASQTTQRGRPEVTCFCSVVFLPGQLSKRKCKIFALPDTVSLMLHTKGQKNCIAAGRRLKIVKHF